MTYWKYWNLSAAPFAHNSNLFFRGATVEEALARIEFLCSQRRNLATLIGPSGVGKSCLLNYLVHSPPRQTDLPTPQVCQVSMLGMASGDLARDLTKKTCGCAAATTTDAWSLLTDCLYTRQRSDAHTLFLIDDVENCGASAETDLIRLVRMAEDKNVSIVLSIETSLTSTVSRWLLDRCYLNIELSSWDLQQTREYVRFVLSRCSGSTTIYTDSAISRMHESSKGIPRRVAQLADLALIAGAVRECGRIDEGIIAQVLQEMPKQFGVAA